MPTPTVTVTSTTDGSAESFGVWNIQETVDTVVHHALVNQSSISVNTLANLIRQVASGTPEQQTGPAYFSVDPSATDKGKNPQEDPSPPPGSQSAAVDPYDAAAGKWATIYSSSSDEWLSFSTSYAASGEVSASTFHVRGASAINADIARPRLSVSLGPSSARRRAGCLP